MLHPVAATRPTFSGPYLKQVAATNMRRTDASPQPADICATFTRDATGNVITARSTTFNAGRITFRGEVYRSLRDRHGVVVGAVVSGLLFGASHVVDAPWRDVVFLQTLMVFTGVGLALIYERRANLVADIAAHAAFNVIGIVIIFSSR